MPNHNIATVKQFRYIEFLCPEMPKELISKLNRWQASLVIDRAKKAKDRRNGIEREQTLR